MVKEEAIKLREDIYCLLAVASTDAQRLEQSWMRLGSMLAQFKATEAWRPLGYVTFDKFMDELRVRTHKSISQLWTYMTVYETLSPYYDAVTLESLGIGKALEIKRAVKETGAALPEAVMAAAQLPTTKLKELRALIGQALNLPDDREKGVWFDLGGCYFTPEEKEEFTVAVQVAIMQLGIKRHVPEHIQRKEIMLAWAREFFQTWAHEVYGPQEPAAPSPGPEEPM